MTQTPSSLMCLFGSLLGQHLELFASASHIIDEKDSVRCGVEGKTATKRRLRSIFLHCVQFSIEQACILFWNMTESHFSSCYNSHVTLSYSTTKTGRNRYFIGILKIPLKQNFKIPKLSALVSEYSVSCLLIMVMS